MELIWRPGSSRNCTFFSETKIFFNIFIILFYLVCTVTEAQNYGWFIFTHFRAWNLNVSKNKIPAGSISPAFLLQIIQIMLHQSLLLFSIYKKSTKHPAQTEPSQISPALSSHKYMTKFLSTFSKSSDT